MQQAHLETLPWHSNIIKFLLSVVDKNPHCLLIGKTVAQLRLKCRDTPYKDQPSLNLVTIAESFATIYR